MSPNSSLGIDSDPRKRSLDLGEGLTNPGAGIGDEVGETVDEAKDVSRLAASESDLEDMEDWFVLFFLADRLDAVEVDALRLRDFVDFPEGRPASTVLFRVEFHLFLIELSVRPSRRCDIFAHLLPSSRCASMMMRSSSFVQAVFLISGSR